MKNGYCDDSLALHVMLIPFCYLFYCEFVYACHISCNAVPLVPLENEKQTNTLLFLCESRFFNFIIAAY